MGFRFSLELHPPDISLYTHKYFRIWKKNAWTSKHFWSQAFWIKATHLLSKLGTIMYNRQTKSPKLSKVNFLGCPWNPSKGHSAPAFSVPWTEEFIPFSPQGSAMSQTLTLTVAPASPALLSEPRPVPDFSVTSRAAGKESSHCSSHAWLAKE